MLRLPRLLSAHLDSSLIPLRSLSGRSPIRRHVLGGSAGVLSRMQLYSVLLGDRGKSLSLSHSQGRGEAPAPSAARPTIELDVPPTDQPADGSGAWQVASSPSLATPKHKRQQRAFAAATGPKLSRDAAVPAVPETPESPWTPPTDGRWTPVREAKSTMKRRSILDSSSLRRIPSMQSLTAFDALATKGLSRNASSSSLAGLSRNSSTTALSALDKVEK
jgi:hypothetical protein